MYSNLMFNSGHLPPNNSKQGNKTVSKLQKLDSLDPNQEITFKICVEFNKGSKELLLFYKLFRVLSEEQKLKVFEGSIADNISIFSSLRRVFDVEYYKNPTKITDKLFEQKDKQTVPSSHPHFKSKKIFLGHTSVINYVKSLIKGENENENN